MSVALIAAVAFVVYQAIAGIVFKAAGGSTLPHGEHCIGRGRYKMLDCDGPWSFDFVHCQRCEDWKQAVLAAWLWPVTWIVWLPVRIFRAAANVSATPVPESEVREQVRSGR